MITFTKFGEYGRLGNQLFQYASLRGLAEKTNHEFKLPNIKGRNWHSQNCLLGNFNITCNFLDSTDSIDRSIVEPCQGFGNYSPSIESSLKEFDGNISLLGFFQNIKYFSNIEDKIKKELSPHKKYIDEAKKYIETIRNDMNVVSVHLRRGDVVSGPNSHIPYYGETDIFDPNTIFGSYFSKAIEHFDMDSTTFLLFTGGSRTGDDTEDIQWTKKMFRDFPNFVVSDSNDPMKDLSRIISCDSNVACFQSSFGWWAAYLNTNGGKVVAPKDYFQNGILHDGFYPEEWILI